MAFSLRWPENIAVDTIPFNPTVPKEKRRHSCESFPQTVARDEENLYSDLSKSLDHSVLVCALEGLLNNQRTGDVEIIVDGRTIYAHSPILSSRSPVFRNTFESGFRESLEAKSYGGTIRIEVSDFSYDVMYAFITYIYTNRMIPTVSAKDIFLIADKYEVLALRDLAEKAIIDNLTVDKVCNLLFTFGHRFPSLRSKMIFFIATNFMQIDQRCDLVELIQDYKDQMADGDYILVEIMRSMSKKSLTPPSTPAPRITSGFSIPSIPSIPQVHTPIIPQQSNSAGGFFFGFDMPTLQYVDNKLA